MNAIVSIFTRALKESPDAPALQVAGVAYSYAQLAHEAARMQALIARHAAGSGAPVALFSSRALSAYACILACLASGRAWVPLNPEFPGARNRAMLTRSGATLIVADQHYASAENPFLSSCQDVVVVYSNDDTGFDMDRFSLEIQEVKGDTIAYMLFTSGTTGVPKGIPITHDNLTAYVNNFNTLFALEPGLRFSQLFDLTFDLSIHDMSIAWSNAGCLVVPTAFDVLMPVQYVRRHQLDVWFSVPSLASIASQSGLLRPDTLPTLKYSFFCGEALPTTTVTKWLAAAPHSTAVNLYGPTEATIAITHYSLSRESNAWHELPVAPIGSAYPGQYAVVVDDNGALAGPEIAGELWLGGSQLFDGYLNDAEKTSQTIVTQQFEGIPNSRWYRTGDIAVYTRQHGLRYLGRSDRQTKIHGYRVELQEVEHALRQISETDLVAVVPWPRQETGSYGGLVAFIAGSALAPELLQQASIERLPAYMRPSSIRIVDALPVNANGKVDYKHLESLLS